MSSQPHILVIDDEPQILRALRTILLARQLPRFDCQPRRGRPGAGGGSRSPTW